MVNDGAQKFICGRERTQTNPETPKSAGFPWEKSAFFPGMGRAKVR
jgi:hypothetical protein